MAADWAVAAGTGALALATFWLAWQARKEAAIEVYGGTEDEYVADWAREVLRLLDERPG
jgi:hypothetical protein